MSWWHRLFGGKDAELIRELKGRDDFLAESAAHELGRVGGKRAVVPLIRALRSGRTRQIRSNAAVALGQLKDRRALRPLQEAVLDPEEHVWFQAAAALAGFPDVSANVVDELARGSREQRLVARRVLARIRDPRAAEPLDRLLRDEKVDAGIRAEAAFALGSVGDSRAVEPLILLLRDETEDTGIRAGAASALGHAGDRRAVEPLLEALEKLTGHAKTCAARALGELRDERATSPLAALLSDPDWHVREAAVSALGQIADPRVADALAVGLEDENLNTRMATEKALSAMMPPGEVESLKRSRQRRLQKVMIRAELERFLRSDRTRQFEATNGTWWTDDDLALVLVKARLDADTGAEAMRQTTGEVMEEMLREGRLVRGGGGYRAAN